MLRSTALTGFIGQARGLCLVMNLQIQFPDVFSLIRGLTCLKLYDNSCGRPLSNLLMIHRISHIVQRIRHTLSFGGSGFKEPKGS